MSGQKSLASFRELFSWKGNSMKTRMSSTVLALKIETRRRAGRFQPSPVRTRVSHPPRKSLPVQRVFSDAKLQALTRSLEKTQAESRMNSGKVSFNRPMVTSHIMVHLAPKVVSPKFLRRAQQAERKLPSASSSTASATMGRLGRQWTVFSPMADGEIYYG